MNEEISRSEASELDGLPDADRKETQEIIDEIGKDEKTNADEPTGKEAEDAAAAKAKADADAAAIAAGKDGKSDEGKVEPPRKSAKLVPAWVLERAKDESAKKIQELTEALNLAKAGRDTDAGKTEAPNANQVKELEDEIAKVAEEHKLDPKLVKSLIDLGMKHGGKLPQEITEKLATIDAYKASTEVQAEEQAFKSAFDEHVIPLIKKEFGDKVAPDTIEAIRDLMKEKAYTEEFKGTPYSVIYKGVDDFRKFSRTTAKSAEGSRGGAHAAGEDGEGAAQSAEEEFGNVTDADIDKMDGPTFDRYSAYQQGRERNRR